MAMNPMQRRARNSFLVGFLVALIIMAVVVFILLFQIKSIKEAKEKIEALQKQVLVATSDLKSGQSITIDDFTNQTVQTTVNPSDVISATDFEFTDNSGEIITKIDEDGNELKKSMVMKIDVPSGTIVTKNMISETDDQTGNSERIQELNMIVLPSQLLNGDYIDIRLSMPNGQDFIVLSKKKVLGTNSTSIWLKLSEEELLVLTNSIVEAYTITGSKLYAIQYIEPGLQDKPIPTYNVSSANFELIAKDPNFTEEAKQKLYTNYSTDIRRTYIEPELQKDIENQGALVSAGNSNEIEKIQAAREEFVESLEGSEDVGYSR